MNIEPIPLQPSQQTGKWLWGINALLAIGLTVMLGLKYQHDTADNADELVSARTLELNSGAQKKKPIEAALNANAASAASQAVPPFDWDAILLALEQVRMDGVIIDSVKIDAQTRQLALILSFQSYDQVGQYLVALNQMKRSGLCVLVSADRASTGDPPGKAAVTCRL